MHVTLNNNLRGRAKCSEGENGALEDGDGQLGPLRWQILRLLPKPDSLAMSPKILRSKVRLVFPINPEVEQHIGEYVLEAIVVNLQVIQQPF